MRITGNPAAATNALTEAMSRRAEGTATAGNATDAARTGGSRPTVTSAQAPVADPADVLTRAAGAHRASQVVAAQNTAAAASLASVPQAALAGLLPMPS